MSEIQGGERIPKKIPDLTHTEGEHITEIRYQGDCSYQRKARISEKNNTGDCRSEIANRKQFQKYPFSKNSMAMTQSKIAKYEIAGKKIQIIICERVSEPKTTDEICLVNI